MEHSQVSFRYACSRKQNCSHFISNSKAVGSVHDAKHGDWICIIVDVKAEGTYSFLIWRQ